jgi:hypothetical protein
VSEWLAEIVNQILFLGFFLALLENSVTWGQAIVNSFRQAAGGAGIAPSDVFPSGVELAQKVMSHITLWDPGASAGLIVSGLVIDGRTEASRFFIRKSRSGLHAGGPSMMQQNALAGDRLTDPGWP